MALRIVLNLTHAGTDTFLQSRFMDYLITGVKRGDDVGLCCIGILINIVDANPRGFMRVIGGILAIIQLFFRKWRRR
jgi:hypothetical protein